MVREKEQSWKERKVKERVEKGEKRASAARPPARPPWRTPDTRRSNTQHGGGGVREGIKEGGGAVSRRLGAGVGVGTSGGGGDLIGVQAHAQRRRRPPHRPRPAPGHSARRPVGPVPRPEHFPVPPCPPRLPQPVSPLSPHAPRPILSPALPPHSCSRGAPFPTPPPFRSPAPRGARTPRESAAERAGRGGGREGKGRGRGGGGATRHLALATAAPASRSEWPPQYLERATTEMSTPSSKGRSSPGDPYLPPGRRCVRGGRGGRMAWRQLEAGISRSERRFVSLFVGGIETYDGRCDLLEEIGHVWHMIFCMIRAVASRVICDDRYVAVGLVGC